MNRAQSAHCAGAYVIKDIKMINNIIHMLVAEVAIHQSAIDNFIINLTHISTIRS